MIKDGSDEWLDEQFREQCKRNTWDKPALTKELLLEENSRGTLCKWCQSLGMGERAGQNDEAFRSMRRPIRCNGQDVRSELQGGKAFDSQ